MESKIESQIAFVTGGNRGIGRAIVEALLSRGVSKVYAAARDVSSLTELTTKYGDKVVPVSLDVTNPAEVDAAAKQAGDVTLLINNAGYLGATDLFTGELEAARQEFEVNYWGVLNTVRAFTPILQQNPNGTIVSISSVAGLSNFPALPTYSDSKAATHSLIVGTRLLLAAKGIHVIGVYPGPVDTDMAGEIEMEKASPVDVANKIIDGIETKVEDIFPDAFAENYKEPYQNGQKVLEQRVAQMMQQPA